MKKLIAVSVLISSSSAFAIDPIPKQPGWSGMFILGVSSLGSQSNMIAGTDGFDVDVGEDSINSLANSADTVTNTAPLIGPSFKYTFPTRTQLFLGGSIENPVQFDTVSVAGVRQQFADDSIIEVAALFTPEVAAMQVWSDPYVINESRRSTDRTSQGARIEYDRILNTGLGIQLSSREIEIDHEFSGSTQLALASDEQQLLDRNGDERHLKIHYRFPNIGHHGLQVGVGQRQLDLDGEAMSGDMDELQLSYFYMGERFFVTANGFYWTMDHDQENPIFNETQEDDIAGVSLMIVDRGIFNSKHWSGHAAASWVSQDSNIDFYSAESSAVSIGATFSF